MGELELKPCPFCGAYGAFVRTECPTMWVECRFCGAQGPFAHGERHAVEVWNARADELPQRKAVSSDAQ